MATYYVFAKDVKGSPFKTVYGRADLYLYLSDGDEKSNSLVHPYFPGAYASAPSIAWQMAYGSNNVNNVARTEWPRPKDNKLLTASFDITVEESEGGE